MKIENVTISVSEKIGIVSAIWMTPIKPFAVMVLAHGAGAGMNHPFMASLSEELEKLSVATLRYNFPYMEKKQGRPDPAPIAEKTVKCALEVAHKKFPSIPLFAAGKSFGGRMSSQRLSKDSPLFVNGLIFYGFPLHPLGAPGVERAAHLKDMKVPMLFLQGSRDKMAEPPLLKKVMNGLPEATLDAFEGADHSFKAGKQNLIPALAEHTVMWIKKL
jgi:hypothetical protein